MIELLEGTNFQTHRRIHVEFSPTITTIIGETDAGKSAILRLLEWVCLNEPSGTKFVRHGADDCEGSVTIDGQRIGRAVGPGINRYTLGKKTFTAFGRSVPDEIASLVNLGEVNFQRQITLPFLFSLTPGQVGRELNGVVALGEMDKAVSAAQSGARRARDSVSFSEERLQKAKEEAESLTWVVEADKELQKLEQLYSECEELRLGSFLLSDLITDVRDVELRRDRAAEERLDAVNAIAASGEVMQLRLECETLSELIESLQTSEKTCRNLERQYNAIWREIEQLNQGNCLMCGRPFP